MGLTQEENLIIQSYLNCILIASLKRDNFFESKYFNELDYGDDAMKKELKKIGILNTGMVASLLYSMLVLPKEKILKIYKSEFNKLNESIDKIKDKATNSNYPEDRELIDYVRHIRNALTHGNISVGDGTYVEFYDEDKFKNPIKTCTIRIPLNKLGYILGELQQILHQYINDIQLRNK